MEDIKEKTADDEDISKIFMGVDRLEPLFKTADEIRKIKRKEYYQKNKERIKKYREENIEKIKEREKKYKEKNKEKIREQKKQWYEKNREKSIERQKEYRNRLKESIPISTIQEYLEELKDDGCCRANEFYKGQCVTICQNYSACMILQKLLKEGNKYER